MRYGFQVRLRHTGCQISPGSCYPSRLFPAPLSSSVLITSALPSDCIPGSPHSSSPHFPSPQHQLGPPSTDSHSHVPRGVSSLPKYLSKYFFQPCEVSAHSCIHANSIVSVLGAGLEEHILDCADRGGVAGGQERRLQV